MKRKILLLITVFSLLSMAQIVGAIDSETGILEIDEDGKFYIGTLKINFGPNKYIKTTTALFDYDLDTKIELIYNELLGIVEKGEDGYEVTLGGVKRINPEEDCFIVFTINNLLYREPKNGPWR